MTSFQFYIQNYTDGLYLSDVPNEKNSRPVIATEKSARVDFSSTTNPDGSHIIKPDTSDFVLDVKDQSELIYWPKHGGSNQQFKLNLIERNIYNIQGLGFCVTYSSLKKTYLLKTCSGKDTQKFIITTSADEERENKFKDNVEVYDNRFTNSSYEVSKPKRRRRQPPNSKRYWYSEHKLPVITSVSQHTAHQRHVRHHNNDSY